MARDRLGVAVVGAGYWGPNLVRNFATAPDWELRAVCDLDRARAAALSAERPGVTATDDLDEVLRRDDVDAVAVATPARTHGDVVGRALASGKHVLVEKPLAHSVAAGRAMVAAAEQRGLVLMTDHTYCYTPAVLRMRELVHEGAIGDVLYVDATRINLGLVQPDVDVLWDLAPHDLAILDFVLPGGLAPTGVTAFAADPLGAGKACIGYLTLPLPGGALAHVNVNWLSPTKIRRMVVGGTRRTLVWDDLNPVQRLSVYDRGVDLVQQDTDDRRRSGVSYRLGDTWSPALPEHEPLSLVVAELAAAIREGRPARTDGRDGLRVLTVLEQAAASLARGGAFVPIAAEAGLVTVGGAA
ncbi:Gfo/Idh/MocA family oxidoreductase [Nocardioides zeae]|uniref:Gfo/Idh/MocA family oxidoreductase n=1 Tax=Nocardioides imazamoxiresistens TaxID=3231893 RepID=A0ABU3PTL8_9ACTN|nr:Gfo/Idh/MocA family oxidoreductase [Nocardioides zeae]MDT9592553.1 Gfo/Idh/MocA family oxidoreductase [Nocardioides zeae]